MISKKIFNQKTTDYTFTILFFLIFSGFVVFAIRPSLTTVASLRKEELDLKKINSIYEEKIMEIAKTQTLMEQNRDLLFLLEEAIPAKPLVNKIIDDVNNISSKSSLLLEKSVVGEVNLKSEDKKNLNKLSLTIEANASFENTLQFIQGLFQQRRLKTIHSLKISKEKDASPSGQLKIQMKIEGYYL